MARNALFDWNGTIIKYPNEGKLWGTVGMSAATDFLHPISAGKAVFRLPAVLKAKKAYQKGEVDYDETYRAFDKAVRGIPRHRIEEYIDNYVYSHKTLNAIDEKMIQIAHDVDDHGGFNGIISTGYEPGIRKIIERLHLYTYLFDIIKGNDIKWDHNGKYQRFDLNLHKNKHIHLIPLLRDRGIDPRETAYIGDSQEDDGCFQDVGLPILSPHAKDEFRDEFLKNYPHGFVLEDTNDSYIDCMDYIQKK